MKTHSSPQQNKDETDLKYESKKKKKMEKEIMKNKKKIGTFGV